MKRIILAVVFLAGCLVFGGCASTSECQGKKQTGCRCKGSTKQADCSCAKKAETPAPAEKK